MKIGTIGDFVMPEGMLLFIFCFGHQGASLFSNLNSKFAVLGV